MSELPKVSNQLLDFREGGIMYLSAKNPILNNVEHRLMSKFFYSIYCPRKSLSIAQYRGIDSDLQGV